MQESLATKHHIKLFPYTLENFLNSRRIADEGSRHLQTPGRNVTHCTLDVIWYPLYKELRVFVMHVEYFLLNLLRRHSATENRSARKESTVTWVCSAHHVLGVEQLLGQLRYSEGSVTLRSTRGKGSKSDHKEVRSRERDEI